LLITDQTMPSMTGAALGTKVQSIRSDLPMIICSGYTDTLSPADARRIGFRCYVHKPYSISRLSEIVHTLLSEGTVCDEEYLVD
jgi:DNA-binding NarL/FixJ family response regulator